MLVLFSMDSLNVIGFMVMSVGFGRSKIGNVLFGGASSGGCLIP